MKTLAILDTDTPAPNVAAKRGEYHDIFKALLVKAGLNLEEWDVKGYDVVTAQEYPTGKVDALLLTGSKHDAYKDDPWMVKLVDFTSNSLQQGVRVIGICFGHQIAARALGAEVGPNEKGWELSSIPVKLTEIGQRIYGKEQFNIMQMHRDIVKTVPANAEVIGYTDVCKIQGLYIKGSLISTQGHPEFDKFIIDELVGLRRQFFTPEQADEALRAAAEDSNDGVEIASEMVKFINGHDF